MVTAIVSALCLDVSDPIDLHLLGLCLRGLEPNTRRTYNSHWRRFLEFCLLRGLRPLPAAPATVYRYVAFLSQEGKVAADCVGGYVTAINTIHRDNLLPPPVDPKDHLLARLYHGYSKTEVATKPLRIQPIAFPAAWVWRILCLGLVAPSLTLKRSALAVVLSFVCMISILFSFSSPSSCALCSLSAIRVRVFRVFVRAFLPSLFLFFLRRRLFVSPSSILLFYMANQDLELPEGALWWL
jgi:hypothetical protein